MGHAHRTPVRAEETGRARRAPAQEEIAKLAYSYWEARGGRGGSALEDWLRAERELSAQPGS